ncbi:MAG TPA: type II toxin-antitoxin system VapC family toxin [Thermomicrobiales bacterium]|nr:type II toxin-antitoxin system VapC family toxin [Thermomicrobiales bacterium]
MALYFLDTSALAKRYISEIGSGWVRTLCVSDSIVISAIALTEMSSVFARRHREGAISISDRNALIRLFQAHVRQYALVDVDRTILNSAGALIIQAPATTAMRSLDAIQLACGQAFVTRSAASNLGPLTFVSADLRLLAAAQWAGFATDNPDIQP